MKESTETPSHFYRTLLGKVKAYRRLPKGLPKEQQEKELKDITDIKEPSEFYKGKVITRQYVKKESKPRLLIYSY